MSEDLITRAETLLEVVEPCDCGDDDCVLAGRRRNKALADLAPELVAEVKRLRARALPETVVAAAVDRRAEVKGIDLSADRVVGDGERKQ